MEHQRVLCIALFMILLPGIVSAKTARVGFLSAYYPWIAAMADGKFESASNYEIEWKKFETGAEIINALEKDEIDLGSVGSPPIAAALSLGHEIELFWILQSASFAESLIIRNNTRIVKPQDLRGRRIAAPFASTSHYHLIFALSQFRIGLEDVRLRYSNPKQIQEQWDAGEIDAAYVWNPVHDLLLPNGKIMITSGRLSRWGKPTFDGFVADRNWAQANQPFMLNFVKTLAAADNDFQENRGKWGQNSKNIQKLIDTLGGSRFSAAKSLRLTKFPRLKEQVTKRWLGGGFNSGAALALEDTARFLKEHGVIKSTLNDYAAGVNPVWAQQAVKDNAR